MGLPRPALHQERIVQTATVLLDDGGIENLSMRRLARRLDVTAAAVIAEQDLPEGAAHFCLCSRGWPRRTSLVRSALAA